MFIKTYGQIAKDPNAPCNGTTTVSFRQNARGQDLDKMGCYYQTSDKTDELLGKRNKQKSSLVFIYKNILLLLVQDNFRPVEFWVYFQAQTENLLREDFLFFEESGSSFFALPGFYENLDYPPSLRLRHRFILSPHEVLMLSFPRFQVYNINNICHDYLIISDTEDESGTERICHERKVTARLLTSSVVVLFWSNDLSSALRPSAAGIKVRYSFHRKDQTITQRPRGLFDCFRHYEGFRPHLHCNLKRECLGGEDEAEQCPYTGGLCPLESVYIQGKCLHFLDVWKITPWYVAREWCVQKGLRLATFKTQEEMDMLSNLWDGGLRAQFYWIGLHTISAASPMYRQIWFWADGTPNYYNNVSHSDYSRYDRLCAYISIYNPVRIYTKKCSTHIGTVICESRLPVNSPEKTRTGPYEVKIEMKDVIHYCNKPTVSASSSYTSCRNDRFLTHSFLTCDPKSGCREEYLSQCVLATTASSSNGSLSERLMSVEMFRCDNSMYTIHYTMVCDFRDDCLDHSDETHCQHKLDGSGFRCRNGQWITDSKLCDMIEDCLDGSDEDLCDNHRTGNIVFHSPRPPALLHHDGRGGFAMEPLDPAYPTCPKTHFPCPGVHLYCLPVYLKCNGVRDCLYGEDENGCNDENGRDDVTCPGYYRCRLSSVCLHVDHVCDGWPQCPERDDELLCDATCPSACHCQGLAFVCHQPFHASLYPDLRYLDATGSGMVPENITDNYYLAFLSLAGCGVAAWPSVNLPNLRILDLSNNLILAFSQQHLKLLPNLRVLHLDMNPLTTFEQSRIQWRHKSLLSLSINKTLLTELNATALAAFETLQYFSVSFSSLIKINDNLNGSLTLKHLVEFSAQGCDLEEVPVPLLLGSYNLRYIYAKNQKICCPDNLPKHFNPNFCFAERDEISSCDDLLRSSLYHVFVWISTSMAFVGNAVSLCYKLFCQGRKEFKSGYGFFVFSLSLSDVFMGFYLAMIGTANEIYRGRYSRFEKTWKTSWMCSVAGLMSLLSYEVSAFMICLITIDRFLVLRFPFSTVRFNGGSALAASAVAWTLGFLLSVLPLMPSLSHWKFYSQTGICVPLPVTRQFYEGKSYSFGVMIIFNFALFLLIAVGQVSIYLSIRSNSVSFGSTTKTTKNMTIARRLVTVAVSDFLCWFPVGVLGLAASAGVPIPGEVSVAVVIFVLPLNAALNPFLYTYNVLMEKRRRRQEAELLKEIRAQILKERIRF